MDYTTYFDKVFGCWLGKCIAGVIGAPYEGMKQLLDVQYSPDLFAHNVPNDDLDLQILWLEVLEEKGTVFTADDLAKAFYERCPYAPGEYAVFKKNYAKGIGAPLCGQFNNGFFAQGMGSPIRSEIWACVAPGNPELAAEYAGRDGVLDHYGDSVYGELFFAALESAAFTNSDIDTLINDALQYVPRSTKLHRMITDTVAWCRSEDDWKRTRGKILRRYGHPHCCNVYENIAFTLLALLYGKGDFINTVMIALNCGFDTDCTCATAGAVLGIVYGADCLMKKHGLTDVGYELGVTAHRRSDTIRDLALDTCAVGLQLDTSQERITDCSGAPATAPVSVDMPAVRIGVSYEDDLPSAGPGETRNVEITFSNGSESVVSGAVNVAAPDNWTTVQSELKVSIAPGSSRTVRVAVTMVTDIDVVQERNIFTAALTTGSGEIFKKEFGVSGAAVWQVYGPFWENNVAVPELKSGESYYDYLKGEDVSTTTDRARDYQINSFIDFDKDYLGACAPGDPAAEPEPFVTHTDWFNVGDMVGFDGRCVVYATRDIVCPEARAMCVQVGHTDPFELKINGTVVARRDAGDWWTSENVHVADVLFNEGVNRIELKLARQVRDSRFSLVFSHRPTASEHYCDIGTKMY